MNNNFNNINKNFGFGCMRLPMIEKDVDIEQTKKMFDEFIEAGFNYFDTAHGYIGGKSELAIKECLTSRYERSKYILTNKLSSFHFECEDDLEPLFKSQLEACGVDYFDIYLMHSQNKLVYEKYKKHHVYEFGLKKKEQGLIKHFGISFHDTADVLEEILKDYPEIEVVQIQFNYLDYLDPAIQSKACYDVCRKYHKPVIVMEPVKGGNLVNLPSSCDKYLKELNGGSNASYAIRFAASFEGIMLVLSGMSNLEQLRDNISYMKEFKPLNEIELNAVNNVVCEFKKLNAISCTACRYCIDDCPKHISIPDLFACLNSKKLFNDWNADFYYNEVHTKNKGKASDCIKCGKCEQICPQHLEIRKLLISVKEEFEKRSN